MEPGALCSTCVLKVNNIGCCKACVVNLKKLLWRIEGVEGVDVDEETELVTVTGKVDPQKLINKIAKKKKKAELVSCDDTNAQTKSDERRRDHKFKKPPPDDSDHEPEDYVPPPNPYDECRDRHCRIHQRNSIIHTFSSNFLPRINLRPPPWRRPKFLPLPPPHRRPGAALMGDRPHRVLEPILRGGPLPPVYDHGDFCSRPLPPPPRPYYGGYYWDRHVPATNNITHMFSDENATGCSIM